MNKAYYGKAFSRFEYMGEVSVICHLPFGAISAYVNHYSSPRREWNVGMTIGCVIRLEVEEENERAVKVYEKNGFHVLPYMEMITNE